VAHSEGEDRGNVRLNVGGRGFISVDGYGRLSLGLIKALLYAGHDIHPFELRELKGKPSWYVQAQGLDFSHATLQIAPPNEFQSLSGRSACYTMHESMTLPPNWANWINEKNQLCLVPSPWLIDLLQDEGVKLSMRVVPGGIDPVECPLLHRHKNGPYTFICLADRGNRKGHNEVYQAFYKAFQGNRDVRLIMKCRPASLPHMDFSYSTDPRLTIWRADVEQVADVFAVADAAINPNHCEGYGMWPREAAACGLPTLTTRAFGTADDIDQWATPLEHFKLVESYMAGCGGLWAYPDVDEIAWRMRDMYEKRDEYKAQALIKRQWLHDNLTYSHSARKLLEALGWWLGGPITDKPTTSVDIPAAVEANRTALAILKQVVQVKSSNGHVTKKELAQP
jgi:glycosyltransferase involved in cell wall biosynthesis